MQRGRTFATAVAISLCASAVTMGAASPASAAPGPTQQLKATAAAASRGPARASGRRRRSVARSRGERAGRPGPADRDPRSGGRRPLHPRRHPRRGDAAERERHGLRNDGEGAEQPAGRRDVGGRQRPGALVDRLAGHACHRLPRAHVREPRTLDCRRDDEHVDAARTLPRHSHIRGARRLPGRGPGRLPSSHDFGPVRRLVGLRRSGQRPQHAYRLCAGQRALRPGGRSGENPRRLLDAGRRRSRVFLRRRRRLPGSRSRRHGHGAAPRRKRLLGRRQFRSRVRARVGRILRGYPCARRG